MTKTLNPGPGSFAPIQTNHFDRPVVKSERNIQPIVREAAAALVSKAALGSKTDPPKSRQVKCFNCGGEAEMLVGR